MKKQNIIIGLLALMLAGLFIATNQKVQGNPNQPHQVMFISIRQGYHYDENGRYIADELLVDKVDASPGCPVVPINTSLTATVATLMDMGFSYQPLNYSLHLLTK